MMTAAISLLLAQGAGLISVQPQCETRADIRGGSPVRLSLGTVDSDTAFVEMTIAVNQRQAERIAGTGLRFAQSSMSKVTSYGLGGIQVDPDQGPLAVRTVRIGYSPAILTELAASLRIAFVDGEGEKLSLLVDRAAVSRFNACVRSRAEGLGRHTGRINNISTFRAMVAGQPRRPLNRRDPRDFYPASANREGRGGSSTVSFSVQPSGRVYDCRVEKSSGHADLDAATCKFMSAAPYFPPVDSNGNFTRERPTMTLNWLPPE